MSVLTRIKNNQITDSTILANTKIVPGSIVGSLFNSNLTMTSDVTITGNLTVQGSSTYLTVASTNTYVNDPLIVMNNAFVGTNTNDIGLLFNRGSDTNQAFIWDESEDEFRLIATSETGDTYGAVTTSSYANVRVGNLNVEGLATLGSLSTSGNIGASNVTITGDLALNGGDLTTTAATFNLLTSGATTVNAFTAATTLELGAATGTTNINNNLDVDGNISLDGENLTVSATTFDLINTTATTVNFAGAATTLTIAATSGNTTIRNNLDVSLTLTAQDINSTVIGNVAPAAATFTTATVQGNTSLGLTSATAINNTPIGNATPSTGEFTTLNSSNTTQLGLTSATAINNTPIGNATPSTGKFTTLTTTNNANLGPLTAESINNTVIGNVAPTSATFTTANVQGNTSLGLTTASAINDTPIGNATPSTGKFTTLTTTNNANLGPLTAESINGTVIGNVAPTSATFTTATVQGNTSLGLTSAAAINNTPIGNATPSTGSFTTLLSSGVTQVTDTTAATSVGSGAFRVDGGASVSGNLWVGGNINIVGSSYVISGNAGVFYGDVSGFGALYAGVTGYTSLPSTVVQTAGTFNGYIQNNFENLSTGELASTDWVATAGNGSDTNHYINMGITSPNWDGTQDNSLTTALSGNDGYLYAQGDAGNGGNLVIGASTPNRTVSVIVGGNTASDITAVYRAPGTVSTNTTTGALTVIGGVGILGNIYANNISTGESISTADLTLTGDLAVNGGDIITTASTFNLLTANAATMNAFTAATTLNIGADTGTITINNNTIDLEGNVNVNKTTPSTNSTSGALVVDGGVGVAGNLNVGENVVITGNLTVQGGVTTINTATLDVEDLNITVAKGAADSAAANGAGLTVDGASATLLYNHATTSWDLNKITRVTDDTNTTNETSGALRVAGGAAIAKDLFVGGGNIITDETTFNLLDATVTTLNIGGAATSIDLGATTGTLTINNPTVVGSQTSQDLYNTTATTVNFAGAATTLTIGAVTGTTNIRNALVDIDGNATVGGTLGVTGDTTLTGDLAVNGGDLTTTASDLNLFNSNATKVQFVQAGTEIIIGAVTGSLTINNPTVVGTQSTQDLYNTTATTLNFAGAATTLNIGASTGTLTLNNATVTTPGQIVTTRAGSATTGNGQIFLNGSTSNRIDWNTNGTGAPAFTTRTAGTKVVLYPALSGSTVDYAIGIDSATMWSSVPENTSSFNFKWYGAETLVANLSGTGNFTTVGDIAVNGGDLTTTAGTFNLVNTDATTVNFAGAATTVNIGATSGNTNIKNNLDVDLTLNARDINNTVIGNVTPAAATFTNLTTTGTANLGPIIAESINSTVIGNITPDAATFTTLTSQGTTQLSLTSATAINNTPIGNATPSTGAFTTLTTNSTANLGPLTAESINGTVIGNVSPASGDFTRLAATGIVYANSTIASTNHTTGAVVVAGGVGVGGNLHVSANSQIVVGAELNSNLALGNVQAAFVGNAAGLHSIVVRNISANSLARSEIKISNDSWDNVDVNELRIGLASSEYSSINDPLIKAKDSFLYNSIGNLVVGSQEADIVFFAGGIESSESEVARIVSSNRSLTVVSNVESTSSSTGALIVTGGVGVGANLNVYGGTVINIDQTAEPFQVKGQFATTLIYADSVTDTVTIGGSNTTPVSGATLRVNGSGAMILPVGTTSQRPGSSGNVDVAGMIRINSSLNILEYYDGTAWQSSQGSFTIINSESFSGNGVATQFTMLGESTTAASIVSINGIVQIPATSYSITGDLLTFTEAPEIGDVIDVRRLTTTVSVDELGFDQNLFRANASYAYISTGSVSSIDRFLIDTNGLITVTGDMEIYGNLTVNGDTNGQINIGDSNTDNVAITAEINSNLVPNANNTYDLGSSSQRWRNVYSYATVHDQTATNVAANATPVLIDRFLTSVYSSAKYLVQIKDGSNIQAAELLLVQDTANAYITTYGVLSSNVELGTFTANVSSGNVNLYYTSTSATNSNVKVHSTYIV